ncbi:uncharacterized protein LOC118761898 [Octopus sinensis]|uniref:Uncharacterized protein LOC118761898 n=1 Tax=Octopus sinensis TaxID=2607531 RepID=A0A7E6EK38_9MOLL|nr:uncharacterized protein LOC118761898 [Octopus sinensis]
MNLKGMETSIQYHLILLLLPYFTLVFSVTPVIGQPTYREGQFTKLTTKCLTDQNKAREYTSSLKECSFRCISRDECEYFTYCNADVICTDCSTTNTSKIMIATVHRIFRPRETVKAGRKYLR